MEAKKLAQAAPLPFQLSLRIRHPSIDPAELSREFGIKAEYSFRAGDPRPTRTHGAAASVHAESYWLGELFPRGPSVETSFLEHPRFGSLREPLGATAAQRLSWAFLWTARLFFKANGERLQKIRAEGGNVTLLVTISTDELRSFSLTPEISRTLSDFDIAVEIEFAPD